MLSRFTLVLLISLVSLSLATAAVQIDHKREGSDDLDPKCDPGYYPGFQTSSFQFDLPAEAFIKAAGSFQHAEWYVSTMHFYARNRKFDDGFPCQIGPTIATDGPDNTIGSTRTGNFSGTFFTERLVEYSCSSTRLDVEFESVAPITFPWVPNPVAFSYYREEWNVESICARTATYFTLKAKFCAVDAVEAYKLFIDYRKETVAGLANTLKAEVFEGTCPGH